MKPRWFLIFLVLILATAPSPAAQKKSAHKKTASYPNVITNFTFRGNRIGDPAEAVIKRSIKIPPDAENPDISLPLDSALDEPWLPPASRVSGGRDDCLKDINPKGWSSCTDDQPDGDTSDTWITYFFFDGKFSGFEMSFPLLAYSRYRTMLIGKYGKPHRDTITTVQNRMGANFEQILSVWNTVHGPMKLYFRYPDIDTGFLILKDRHVEEQAESRQNQQLQNEGKKFF